MRSIRHPRIEDIQLTDIMQALSDPARVAIVKALLVSDRPLTCGDISGAKPKSSMSHHFKALRDAGVLQTDVAGTEHLNSLRTAELDRRFPGLAKALFGLFLVEDSRAHRPRRSRTR